MAESAEEAISFERSVGLVRDKATGLFMHGKKGKVGSAELRIHDPDQISLSHLETAEKGIIHFLPNWTQTMVTSDSAYRFKLVGKMTVLVPFLSDLPCVVRMYIRL